MDTPLVQYMEYGEALPYHDLFQGSPDGGKSNLSQTWKQKLMPFLPFKKLPIRGLFDISPIFDQTDWVYYQPVWTVQWQWSN